MDWLIFSLIGASSLAVTGVIDKFILDKYIRSCGAYLITLIILQQAFALGIYLYLGHGFVYPHSLFAIAIGGLQAVLWVSYLRALQVEETSRIAAMVYVYPIFVFPAAFFFLGETLSLRDYAGGLILVISALLVSYRPPARGEPLILSPALKYMFVFWIFSALYAVAAKYLLSYMDEWHLIMWSSAGNFLAVLPFLTLRRVREEAFGYLRHGRLLTSALIADEIFDFLGRGALIFAYAAGSVALVSSVAALQPFITLIYVMMLSLSFPGVIREEMTPQTLSLKLAAVFLIVLGVYLIS
ncbi:MAG: EamA family transporter [Methanotrichaceae archaeon]|nr:EamA family transporter [Methanotrichaceae archaeon]